MTRAGHFVSPGWLESRGRILEEPGAGAEQFCISRKLRRRGARTASETSGGRGDEFRAIAAAMQPITPRSQRGSTAQYQLLKSEIRQGQPVDVAYFVQFRRNEDGQWEIESF